MGNEVSLPPIDGIPNPPPTLAISQIVTELNSLFTTSPVAPQYLLSFVTTLKTSITGLQAAVTDLQTNTPSPQSQLTALQGALNNVTSSLSNYITSNNAAVSNIAQGLSTLATTVNNLSSSIGSINVVDLASDVSTLSSTINNLTVALANKVDTSTTVNGKALTNNITLTPLDLGLGNVNNTSDANKPISTATQAALDQKISLGPLITASVVGTQSSVPSISYNSNGLITSASNINIAITPTQAGLSNVPNVNATLASNISIDQPLGVQNSNVTQGDNLMLAVSKLQNQQNNNINKLGGGVLDKIASFDATGGVKSSGLTFNDLGSTTADVLSAASVINKINSAVTGVLNLRGTYILSGSNYPSSGGSGVAGAIVKGDLWYVQGSGTLGGNPVNSGDAVIAIVNSPGQLTANWSIISGALSYTPEDSANKNNLVLSNSSVQYPTTGLVKTYVDTGLALKEDLLPSGTSTQYYRGDKTLATLNASAIGLTNVTNDAQMKRSANDYNSFASKASPVTADIIVIEDSQDVYNKKKISLDTLPTTTAVSTSLAGLVPQTRTINSHPLTANITLVPADLGLGNVDNTSDVNKPLSIATTNALTSKVDKINLPLPVTTGTNRKVPVITYNTQGQITNSNEVDIALTKTDVGLGNVSNVDTTNIANISIQGTFTPINLAVVTGDNGLNAFQKIQGQLNNKSNILSPAVLGNILVSDAGGNISNSGKSFSDALTTTNNVLSAAEVQSRINALVSTGVITLIGNFTPIIAATYPLTTANAGNLWYIVANGTLGTTSVKIGDLVLALVNNPGNTASNWAIIQGALGFTPENVSNKETTLTPSSTTKYPTSKAVADYIALNGAGLPSGGTVSQYLRGDSTWQTLNGAAVGLGNVSNGTQLLRAPDFATFPAVNVLAPSDAFIFEDASNGSAKSYVTFSDLQSNINPPVTSSRALQSNGSGVVTASNVTSTELSYLSGATSAIQTQLNNKLDNTAALMTAISTPSAPSVGVTKFYTKADGLLYKMSSDGIEVNVNTPALNVTGTTNGILTRSSGGSVQNSNVLISTDSTFSSPSDSNVPSQLATFNFITSQLITSSKPAVSAVSTSDIAVTGTGTLTTVANGALVVDGYSLQLNESVLLNGQTTSSQNGIYTVTTLGTVSTPTILTRRSDSNSAAEMVLGSVVSVINGTTYSGSLFYQSVTVTTLETDPISFIMINVGIGNLRITNNLSELTGTSATARANISAAKSGANTDITSVTLDNTGLGVKDLGGTNYMTIVNNNTYSANRNLLITTGDQNTTLSLPTTSATVSGVNTGDETSGTIISKVGNASASNTGVLTSTDWTTFNNKVSPTTTVNGFPLSSNVTLTKTDVGLGNVDNTSDVNKPISTATQTALNLKENTANKGVANGYASLDATTKIPLAQIPSLSLANLSDVLFT